MAIMSFAHLKSKKMTVDMPRAPIVPSGPSQAVRNPIGGVMSFAHLKKRKPIQESQLTEFPAGADVNLPDIQLQTVESPAKRRRSFFRIPAVMPTALIIAVNYCRGCGRFLKADDDDPVNTYGSCLRKVDPETGYESWVIIPENATVGRCFFNIE